MKQFLLRRPLALGRVGIGAAQSQCVIRAGCWLSCRATISCLPAPLPLICLSLALLAGCDVTSCRIASVSPRHASVSCPLDAWLSSSPWPCQYSLLRPIKNGQRFCTTPFYHFFWQTTPTAIKSDKDPLSSTSFSPSFPSMSSMLLLWQSPCLS